MARQAISVERISVKRDRISMLVRVPSPSSRCANPQLAAQVLASFPDLAHHACVNERDARFIDVLPETSVPHVLEHLIIDLQAHDARVPADVALTGTTEWLDEAAGLARIEVNYADDLVALRALKEALAFLNERMADCV